MNDMERIDYADNQEQGVGNALCPDVKTWHIAAFSVLGLIISLLSGISDTSGPLFQAARSILVVLLICSLLGPVRWGIPLFLMLALVGPDLAQTASEEKVLGVHRVASIWQLYLGPVRPGWIVAACILIQIIKTKTLVFYSGVKTAIVWFAVVPVLTGLAYGGLYSFAWAIEVPADLRFAILLVMSIVVFHGFLRRYPERLGLVLAILIGGLVGRYICDLIYWLGGYGPMLGGFSRASVDSTKSTVILLLLFAIYLIIKKGKLLTGGVIALLCGLLIVVFGTRMIWVTSALCCMVLVYIFGAKRAAITVPVVFLLVFGSVGLIQRLRTEAMEPVSERAETFATKGPNNYLSRLDPMRYGEIVNSVTISVRRLSLLWGNGYGSYYTDEFVSFPFTLIDAHPDYAASAGKFFTVHNYVFQILFKYGLVGLIIITALWLGPAWKAYRHAFDKTDTSLLAGIIGCLIAFIPNSILNLYWSAKGLLVSGFVIAVLLVAVDLCRQSQETYAIEDAEYE